MKNKMKKTTILFFAVIMALISTSCVKNYSCECTRNGVVDHSLDRDAGKTTKTLASVQCDLYDLTNSTDTINCYSILK